MCIVELVLQAAAAVLNSDRQGHCLTFLPQPWRLEVPLFVERLRLFSITSPECRSGRQSSKRQYSSSSTRPGGGTICPTTTLHIGVGSPDQASYIVT
jgi:hypothetical protein